MSWGQGTEAVAVAPTEVWATVTQLAYVYSSVPAHLWAFYFSHRGLILGLLNSRFDDTQPVFSVLDALSLACHLIMGSCALFLPGPSNMTEVRFQNVCNSAQTAWCRAVLPTPIPQHHRFSYITYPESRDSSTTPCSYCRALSCSGPHWKLPVLFTPVVWARAVSPCVK